MPTRCKAALAAGRVQIGTWINLVRNPAVLTLLKAAGLDYARVDMEHSSPSIETVADMAVLARALDFPLVVRPPAGSREWITRLLDVGVWGLHIPQVDTPEIAREVVQAARYAPLGLRGQAGLGPHNDFAPSGDLPPTRPSSTRRCTSPSCSSRPRRSATSTRSSACPASTPSRSARPTSPRSWACSARPTRAA